MVNYKPEDYELITTVWYTLEYEDEPSYNRLKFQVDDPEDGKGDNFVFSLTTGPNDPNGSWSCMGNDFSLSINLTNTEPSNPRSCITKQYRRRSYLISVPNGELSAEGFYYDIKNTPSGARDNIIYNVSSGSGIFEDAKIIHITVDNDGSIFGQKRGRRVEVFKLKPKQTEDLIIWYFGPSVLNNIPDKTPGEPSISTYSTYRILYAAKDLNKPLFNSGITFFETYIKNDTLPNSTKGQENYSNFTINIDMKSINGTLYGLADNEGFWPENSIILGTIPNKSVFAGLAETEDQLPYNFIKFNTFPDGWRKITLSDRKIPKNTTIL